MKTKPALWPLMGVVVLVGGFGLYMTLKSDAAAVVSVAEAEAGSPVGAAEKRSDPNASGGQYIVFGTAPSGQAITYGSSGNGNPKVDDCTVSVSAGQSIQAAINAAQSGAIVCVKATDRSGESLNINKAITVRANGTVKVKNVTVGASGATLDGFTIVGGASVGIDYSGTNHKIINNVVTGRGITTGISCGTCGSGHQIRGNTVTAIQNYGLWVANGDNITIERNNVYDLWRSSANADVDAMRMWGTDHAVRNNYFHDINEFKSVKDSGGDTPHVDCFQTYQTGNGQVARNILIENNYCVRISRQCIIMSNHLRGVYDIRDFVIRGNVCETYDSSVVNLGSVAGITMENNFFLGGVRSQVLTVDYTREENPAGLPDKDIRLRNNIVMKGLASTSYFYQNSTRTLIDNTKNLLVQNAVVKSNADSFQGSPNAPYAATKADDFTKYRQLAQQYGIIDQGAAPTTVGFATELDGGGRVKGAAIDIGPFEIR